MSITIECDKCRKIIEGVQACKVSASYTSLIDGYVEKTYDLCKECLQGVVAFLTVKKVDPEGLVELDGRNE